VRLNGVQIIDEKEGSMRNDIYEMSKDPTKKEERAKLVHSASQWNGAQRSSGSRPRSRDQFALASAANGRRLESAAEFAAALRGAL